MKKALIFIFTALIINACSDNSIDSTPTIETEAIQESNVENAVDFNDLKSNAVQKSKQRIKNKLIITDIKSDKESSISIMKDGSRIYFGEKEDLITIKEKIESNELQQLDWEGPFQAPSQRHILNNYQIFMTNVPGYASQYFNVQDFEYRGEVYLPPNTTGFAETPNPTGWDALYGNGPRVLDKTVSQSGKYFRISTYTLFINSTLIGQQVGIERPNDLTPGFNYTYYYIENP